MQDTNFNVKWAFTVLFIALFVSMLGLGVVSPLLSIYADDLGATGIWLGAIFSGFNIARAIIMPVVGRLSDRWGRRKAFLIVGMVFFGLSSIGYVLASTALHLFFGRFLQGLGAGMVLPISTAYIGDITPRGKEGLYTSIISIARTLGWGCGPLLSGFISEGYGIQLPFYIMGGLALISCLMLVTALPEYRHIHTNSSTSSYREIFRNKTVRSLVLFRAINAIGTGNLFSFFPLLADSLGASPTEIGILLSSRILTMSLLQGLFGILVDRYDKIKLIIISGAASAVFMLLIPFAYTFIELLVVGILIGVAWAVIMPAVTALGAEHGRDSGMASVLSTINMGFSVGMIIGPITSGFIQDTFDLQSVFYFGGLTAVGAVLIFYFLTRNHQSPS
jgi:DHA1 family multidrug resistance protein-like MFS transporter